MISIIDRTVDAPSIPIVSEAIDDESADDTLSPERNPCSQMTGSREILPLLHNRDPGGPSLIPTDVYDFRTLSFSSRAENTDRVEAG